MEKYLRDVCAFLFLHVFLLKIIHRQIPEKGDCGIGYFLSCYKGYFGTLICVQYGKGTKLFSVIYDVHVIVDQGNAISKLYINQNAGYFIHFYNIGAV